MNKLVELAKEKHYFGFHCKGPEIPDAWYVELCILQKWLREKHKIIISIDPHFYGMNAPYIIKYCYKEFVHRDHREFNTYEEALEQGLLEGLTQIII